MSTSMRGWVPEEVAIMPPGPQLASVLAAADRSRLSNDDLVRMAQARLRLVSHLQAQLLADLYAMGQRCDEVVGEDPTGRVEEQRRRWAEVEVALAMGWTHTAASWQLCRAEDLIEKLPVVFAALNEGSIDIPKAKVFCDATVGLDTPTARRVTDQVIGEAHQLTTGQLRARLRKLVLAADPEAVQNRAKQKVVERRVQARLTDDGLAELAGYDLPPERVAAAVERLTAIARAAKSDGDRRRLDQLKADALLDLLVGDGVAVGGPVTDSTIGTPDTDPQPDPQPEPAGETAPEPVPVEADDALDPDLEQVAAMYAAGFDRLPTRRPEPPGHCPKCGHDRRGALPGPRKGVVEIQVPLVTLLGLADLPGDIAGFGPVIADIARQVVAQQTDAQWRYSVYDPLGQLIHHGVTRRRPTAADAAFIKARDRTCRAPGCRAPASRCDIDHTDDYASSKDSRRCNLSCLCPRHHLFKHLKDTSLIQLTPGVLGWTTPLGQRYVTRPETYVDEPSLAALVDSG